MLESLLGYIVEVSSGLGITLSVFAMTLLISLPLGIIVHMGIKRYPAYVANRTCIFWLAFHWYCI